MCVVEMKQMFVVRRIVSEQLNGQSALASSFSCFDGSNCDKILITHALILFQRRFFLFKSRVECLFNGYVVYGMSPDVGLDSRNRSRIERLMKNISNATISNVGSYIFGN